MRSKEIIKHVSVLLETPDGRLIFHHRDNKPSIVHPDYIGTFGGGVEDGEDYEDAAIREIKEELDLTLQKSDLIFYRSYMKERADGKLLKVKAFIVKGIDPEVLKLNPNEGQGIVIISKNDKWRDYKLTPLAYEFLDSLGF